MKFDLKLALLGLALPLLLVACGGGSDSAATGQAPTASITSPAAGG